MISSTRVFLSYKHDTPSANIVGKIARMIDDDDTCEVWFDQLHPEQLENTIFNRLLQRYFPDVLSLLIGLRSFLQYNLESCDVILFLQPQNILEQRNESALKAQAPGCIGAFRQQIQLQILFWLTIMAYLLAPVFVFLYGWQLFTTFLEKESQQILVALRYYWLTPYWWLCRILGGSVPPSPTFDSKVMAKRWSRKRIHKLPGLGAAARETWYYRFIYGVELPKLQGLFKKQPEAGWQAWELEAATALGLHPVILQLGDSHDPNASNSIPNILIDPDRLEEDLREKVLPWIKGKQRKPLRVRQQVLKGITMVCLGFSLMLMLLFGVLALTIWSIAELVEGLIY